ncbi:bacterial mobilization family protein [Vibrio cholerae CP1035(8)]|nr:bacterial mobilization family protein [Vibrio cholerae CP1035(8)]
MGNNLNQIARAIHSQEWKPVDRVQVIAALASIQRELASIKSENTLDDR